MCFYFRAASFAFVDCKLFLCNNDISKLIILSVLSLSVTQSVSHGTFWLQFWLKTKQKALYRKLYNKQNKCMCLSVLC